VRTLFRLTFFVLLIAGLATAAAASDEKESAAVAAVAPWLSLVDSGQYAESWFQASSDFRNLASKEQWVDALKTVRTPLGKLMSRQLKTSKYTTNLPNTRPGEFVVIQYNTDYEKAPGMIETVVAVLEKSGAWKVTGYYIKRAG